MAHNYKATPETSEPETATIPTDTVTLFPSNTPPARYWQYTYPDLQTYKWPLVTLGLIVIIIAQTGVIIYLAVR